MACQHATFRIGPAAGWKSDDYAHRLSFERSFLRCNPSEWRYDKKANESTNGPSVHCGFPPSRRFCGKGSGKNPFQFVAQNTTAETNIHCALVYFANCVVNDCRSRDNDVLVAHHTTLVSSGSTDNFALQQRRRLLLF
jgi:hypothetical protein